jgi:hypothetical protein
MLLRSLTTRGAEATKGDPRRPAVFHWSRGGPCVVLPQINHENNRKFHYSMAAQHQAERKAIGDQPMN